MGNKRALIAAAGFILLISHNVLASQLKVGGEFMDIGEVFNAATGREKRGLIKGLLIGGAVYGGTKLTVHEIKKHNPCAFHGWGMSDKGEMEHKMAANERCRDYFQKYRSELNRCPNAMSASCQEVNGDTKCAVQNPDGTVIAVHDCVS